jgi:hypothetical protein
MAHRCGEGESRGPRRRIVSPSLIATKIGLMAEIDDRHRAWGELPNAYLARRPADYDCQRQIRYAEFVSGRW